MALPSEEEVAGPPAGPAGDDRPAVRLVRRWLPAGQREPVHTHPYVELCHVQSGRGVLALGPRSVVAAAHTVTVVPPGEAHSLAADGARTCGANLLHFRPALLPAAEARAAVDGLLRLASQGRATASLRGAGQPLAPLIVHAAGLARRADRGAASRAALGELCMQLLRHMRTAPPAGIQARDGAPRPEALGACVRPEVEQALAYIERNLTRVISRQELARQASFAPSYFSAIFREATGSSIPEYINARRVRRAQELLQDPQARVSSVCYAVGFRDLTNFNRVFKRLVGATPREYRRALLADGGPTGRP